MKIRQGLTLAVVAATGLALAGCTGGGGTSDASATDGEVKGSITFQTWSLKNDTFTPYFTDLIKDFEKKYPDATVKWVDQPADGYEDKILQQAESGQLPDVMNLPPDMAFDLQQVDMLVNLEEADPDALDAYVDGGLDAYSYDGEYGVYGYPWYLGTDLNYWNMDLFDKAGLSKSDIPQDMDELFEVAEKAAKSDEKVPMISALPGPEDLMSESESGKTEIFQDGKFVFNTPEAAKMVDKYHEMYKMGAVTPEALKGASTADNNVDTFNKGVVGWTTSGPNYVEDNLATNAPNLVPDIEVTERFGTPPLFVQGVSVPNTSENQATALAFAQFVTNNENQTEFAKIAVGYFPGTIEGNEDPSAFATESEHDVQNTATKLAAGQMDSAEVPNPPQYTPNMDDYAKQQIALAVKGEISGQEALDKAVDFAQENLSE